MVYNDRTRKRTTFNRGGILKVENRPLLQENTLELAQLIKMLVLREELNKTLEDQYPELAPNIKYPGAAHNLNYASGGE